MCGCIRGGRTTDTSARRRDRRVAQCRSIRAPRRLSTIGPLIRYANNRRPNSACSPEMPVSSHHQHLDHARRGMGTDTRIFTRFLAVSSLSHTAPAWRTRPRVLLPERLITGHREVGTIRRCAQPRIPVRQREQAQTAAAAARRATALAQSPRRWDFSERLATAP